MSAADTSSITQSFADWLAASGLLPLHEHGFASLALPTEHSRVIAMNQELKTISAPWLPGLTSWPDDHWAIGEDGAGNYFTVLRSDPRAVYFYDHEQRSIETSGPACASILTIVPTSRGRVVDTWPNHALQRL